MYKYLLLSFLFLSTLSNAQVHKSFHQLFEVSDTVTTIDIQLVGEYQWEYWAGNNIMLQTKVVLYDASPATLTYFWKEAKRYEVKGQGSSEHIILYAMQQERRGIKIKDVECYEEITQQLFIPEGFTEAGDNKFERPNQLEEEDGKY